jgi:hypothetical protein
MPNMTAKQAAEQAGTGLMIAADHDRKIVVVVGCADGQVRGKWHFSPAEAARMALSFMTCAGAVFAGESVEESEESASAEGPPPPRDGR